MASLFDRLGRPTRKKVEQKIDLVARWEQADKAKTFLANALASGPKAAAIITEQAAALGFSKRQLAWARKQLGAAAFKERGKGKFRGGRWFWTLTELTPEQIAAVNLNDRYTRRLRYITKALGYRLQPISVFPRSHEDDI
jgi:hypothetical protein